MSVVFLSSIEGLKCSMSRQGRGPCTEACATDKFGAGAACGDTGDICAKRWVHYDQCHGQDADRQGRMQAGRARARRWTLWPSDLTGAVPPARGVGASQ